jgi:hypothetical protein
MGPNGEHRKGFTGIIRHRETEKYYTGDGQWATEPDEAMKFTSLGALVEEARKYNIKDCCEFILNLVGQPGYKVFLPM